MIRISDAATRRLADRAAGLATAALPDWDRIMARLPDEALEQIAAARPDDLPGALATWLVWWGEERARIIAIMPDDVLSRIAAAGDSWVAARLFWEWLEGGL